MIMFLGNKKYFLGVDILNKINILFTKSAE